MEKIVLFTPSLNIGGIERILLTYANGLAEVGFDVTYLTLSNKGDFEFCGDSNLKFEDLGVNRLRESLFSLISFFKKSRPDIVFVANDATLIVYLANLFSGGFAKIITSQHNYFDVYKRVGFKQVFVPKYIYSRCFKVIAVSEGIRTMLIKEFKQNPEKIVTIQNPIDIGEIYSKSLQHIEEVLERDYILFVGRFDEIKNIPLLLKAFSLFHRHFKNVDLVILGGGPEKEIVLKQIKDLNLEEYVKLLGVKGNPFPYIRNASVIALSSKSEAFPTILLESVSLGKSIVSTPTKGGIDILKNGEYGYISKSIGNVDDFNDALIKGYTQPIEAEKLKNYALDNFSLRIKVDELVRLWKK